MFLTRMYLNPRRRKTHAFIQNPQTMHAAVESAFAPRKVVTGRNLWRLDASSDRVKLILLSASPPSLEHIQEQAGWSTEETWETRPYEQLLKRLQLGQRYAFRLTANPVHTVTGEDGIARRLAHVSAKHQLKWLHSRADQIGVRFLDLTGETPTDDEGLTNAVRITQREVLRFQKKDNKVTLSRVGFEGQLEVANTEALILALTQGIGRAKAYGCGLMTLAPLCLES